MSEYARIAAIRREAFIAGLRAGWEASGEGWNGEYPGNVDIVAHVDVDAAIRAITTDSSLSK